MGTATYIYDKMGDVVIGSQMIAGYQTLYFGYEWYLSGGLKSMTYPSGKKVEYAMDDAGRNTKVSTTGKTYWDTTNVSQPFMADGRVRQAQLGNGLWETYTYAVPGTTTVYSLGTTQGGYERMRLEYNFSGTNNNGNIVSQTVTAAGGVTRMQTFTYDGVNRLESAMETGGYSQSYGYDRWSNRWVSSSSGLSYADSKEPTSSGQFDQSTNRLTGATYDLSGNQLSYNGFTYEYDADGRNTVVKYSNGTTYMTNSYDGEGRRVKKAQGGVTTYYVYDAFGRLAAEYATDTPDNGTSYIFTDMLGSARAITSNAGAMQECYDYLPFGRMLSSSDNGRSSAGCYPALSAVSGNSISSRMSQKFTGQPHDNGTGLDYFGARFYSASLGRFTSPDPSPLGISLRDPQSWNRYSYVANRVFSFVDKNGKWPTPVHLDITTYALQDYVSPQILQQLLSRHKVMDRPSNQSPERAYQHAMRAPGQHLMDASNATWFFVLDGLNSVSINDFGDALHTIQDYTSPTHTDAYFMPYKWSGIAKSFFNDDMNAFSHWVGEGGPDASWERIGMAVQLTMIGYIEFDPVAAQRSGLTYATLETEYQKQMAQYLNNYYTGLMASAMAHPTGLSDYLFYQKYFQKESEAAYFCSIGASAACVK